MVVEDIATMKEQCGHCSPAVAMELNSAGMELQRQGDSRRALNLHQEALTILEWNKRNSLLFDFVKRSKEYAIEMARTQNKIGNLLRAMSDYVGASGAWTIITSYHYLPSTSYLSSIHVVIFCAQYICRSIQRMPG